jgi:hypothetical protein
MQISATFFFILRYLKKKDTLLDLMFLCYQKYSAGNTFRIENVGCFIAFFHSVQGQEVSLPLALIRENSAEVFVLDT